MGLLISCILTGGVAAYIASTKNRNLFRWFILGFLFSIFGIVVVCVLPKLKEYSYEDKKKKCPQCAEEVHRDAIVCIFCDFSFSELEEKKCPQCDTNVKKEARICRFCLFSFIDAKDGAKNNVNSDDSELYNHKNPMRTSNNSGMNKLIKYKKCPNCSEKIEVDATLCPFCTSPV